MYTEKLNHSFGKLLLIALIALSGILTVLPSSLMAQGAIDVKVSSLTLDYNALDRTYDLPVTITNNTELIELGGFGLNIKFAPDVMTLVDIIPGDAMESCGWEYFSYRVDDDGIITVVGLAETNDGSNHPTCYLTGGESEFFVLKLYIPSSESAVGSGYLVEFYWSECTDNLFTNLTGNTLFGSASVFSFSDVDITHDQPLPTISGMPDACLESLNGGNVTALREVNFYNGIIEIYDEDEYNNRGDINMNAISYEVADYVIFTNYFLYGLSAFTTNPEQQTLNSDINDDGRYLETSDLVYLWRIIVGNAVPYPDISPAQTDTAYFVQDIEQKTITMDYPDSLATVAFMFLGNIDINETDVNGVPINYMQQNDTTRVLILDPNGPSPDDVFGEGLIFSYTGEGRLISSSCSSDPGAFVPSKVSRINEEYICGDANNDAVVNISDAVFILSYIFTGGAQPFAYYSGDTNCDNKVNISDVVYIIMYVFRGGNDPCDPNGDGIPDC